MPRKQRLKDEDGEDDELPSGLLPSKRIARKPRKQRLKDEDEEEDDELPSGLLPSRKIARKPRKQEPHGGAEPVETRHHRPRQHGDEIEERPEER